MRRRFLVAVAAAAEPAMVCRALFVFVSRYHQGNTGQINKYGD